MQRSAQWLTGELPAPRDCGGGKAQAAQLRQLDRELKRLVEQEPDLGTIEEGVGGGGVAAVGFEGDVGRVLG